MRPIPLGAQPSAPLSTARILATPLDRVAIHETGHIVAALVKGHTVHSAEIKPDGSGRTGITEDEDEINGDPTVALAGHAAEQFWFGSSLFAPEGSPDYQEAERVAGPDFRQWIPETSALIREHQNAIHLIAGELKRHLQLSGEQIQWLFDLASATPQQPAKNGTFGESPKPSKKPRFGDSPKLSRSPSKRALSPQKVIIEKNTKNGLDTWTFRSGKKGDPYFRATSSGAGYMVHFRHKNGAQRWVEPYACYLSAEEFKRIKRLTFSGVAQVVADRVAERQPSGNVGAEELTDLLHRVREISNPSNLANQPKGDAA